MSPTVKYDVTNVEDIDRNPAPVGIYRAKIVKCDGPKPSSNGNPMLEVQLTLTHSGDGKKLKQHEYDDVWMYPILEHDHPYVQGQLKEFIAAIGLKAKGSLNTDKIVGTAVQLKLKSDTDQDGDYRPRVGKIMALSDEEPADESEPEEEPEAEAGEEEVDLDTLDRDGLKAFIKEQELGTLKDLGITKATTDDEIRGIIVEAMGGEPEDESEPEPEDEPEPEEEESVDLDTLDRTALKKFIKDEDLGTLADLGINKSTTDDEIRGIIATAMGGDEEPEPEDDAEPEPEEEGGADYNSMDVAALKAELKERELPVNGSKKVLIQRLQKDDSEPAF